MNLKRRRLVNLIELCGLLKDGQITGRAFEVVSEDPLSKPTKVLIDNNGSIRGVLCGTVDLDDDLFDVVVDEGLTYKTKLDTLVVTLEYDDAEKGYAIFNTNNSSIHDILELHELTPSKHEKTVKSISTLTEDGELVEVYKDGEIPPTTPNQSGRVTGALSSNGWG